MVFSRAPTDSWLTRPGIPPTRTKGGSTSTGAKVNFARPCRSAPLARCWLASIAGLRLLGDAREARIQRMNDQRQRPTHFRLPKLVHFSVPVDNSANSVEGRADIAPVGERSTMRPGLLNRVAAARRSDRHISALSVTHWGPGQGRCR